MAPPTLTPGQQLEKRECTTDICPRLLLGARDYRTPPSGTSNFFDDPGLIVALCITGLVLLFGFGVVLFSAGPWKRLRNDAAKRKARPQYLKSPKPLARSTTSAPWLEHPVLPEINVLTSAAPLCTNDDLLRFSTESLSLSPGSPPIRDQTPSTPTRLFPVIEEDEESEDGHDNCPGCQSLAGVEQVSADSSADRATANIEDSEETTDTTDADHEVFETESMGSVTSGTSPNSSIHDPDNDEDDVDVELDIVDDAEVFELKRGQTQSLELTKGVLVTLPPGASSIDNIQALKVHSPFPVRLPEKSMIRSRTCPNVRTQAPSIPALIVTQPSTLSLCTFESSTTSISLDDEAVPIPPLHLEPAVFWQRLEEEINHSLAIKNKRR
ncbi:hypothetical protein BKA70DRAFT_654162 [Coprinopsis sp. MPI-PUGE-AT-0042]|nr:hypothetical protein BKA70DRAFT_654162 [Coprinopsis sp. MPI-PUGE-AT-0042]